MIIFKILCILDTLHARNYDFVAFTLSSYSSIPMQKGHKWSEVQYTLSPLALSLRWRYLTVAHVTIMDWFNTSRMSNYMQIHHKV